MGPKIYTLDHVGSDTGKTHGTVSSGASGTVSVVSSKRDRGGSVVGDSPIRLSTLSKVIYEIRES